jgi:hypothetical protein
MPELTSSGIDVVFLTCFRAELSSLALIVQYSSIRLHRAETLEEADFLMLATGATVLVSDLLFLDGTWRDALRMAAEVHPLVGSMVTADPEDWPQVADLYRCGGCSILWKPVDCLSAIDQIRTVDQAARDRRFVHGTPELAVLR